MKRFIILLVFVVLYQLAKADTLAGWTFETSQPSGFRSGGSWFTNVAPEVGLGEGSALHSAPTIYYAATGNGSSFSFGSSNSWSQGDFYQFAVSTAEYQNISISFEQTGNVPGPNSFYLEYSVDGNTFSKFGSDYTINFGNWNSSTRNAADSFSFNLNSITSINGQTELYFRIVDDTTGTVFGDDRIDNVLITAQPVPEPSSSAIIAVGVVSLVRTRKRMMGF